jgi:predicted acylesterase/phospholipase RssA
MVELMDPIEVTYDVIEGVSIGGLNAATLAMFPKGKEKEAVEEMTHTWMTYSASAFWEYWPLYIDGLFYKNSFLDNSKLKNFIEEYWAPDKPDFERSLIV